ncbi:hypothetical protein [Arsenicibacter rosenii]|uniref:Outer membrane protein beta-barrel domain-containing protein n=1 Tax=Arsenicibacter rosenii TaxID=1750698 RepID=A0A1S2VCE7_9BACT|nr:hypothetical protein [Arsenicibacter rosenii]OIN56411.1 hypothetical protein BLX24_24885 [Arsenicibacter rosenii]
MKPDKFSDHIRRKLESVDEPIFRDKDWVQMQRTMQMHGGGVFQPALPQWVLPGAGLMAAAGLSAIIYFQYSANQQLHNEVQTLQNKVTELKQAPAPVLQKTDTVYITRYIDRPGTGSAMPSWDGRMSDDPVDPSFRKRRQPEQFADGRSPAENPYTDKTENAVPSIHSLNPSANETNATSDLSSPVNAGNHANPSGLANAGNPVNNRFRTRNNQRETDSPVYGTNRTRQPNPSRGNYDPYNQGAGSYSNGNGSGGDYNNRPEYNNLLPPGSIHTSQPAQQTWGLANVDELESHLLTVDSLYYQEGMSRITRRMRRMLMPAYAGTAPVIKEPIPDWHWRIGAGGMYGVKQWGAGISGEIRLGKNWIAGVGLMGVNLSGGTFLTDEHYENKTKQNFRKYYAGGIDPKFQILNITRKTMTWQVPVTFGYRLNLPKYWAVTPTLGASINIDNREKIAFNYLRAPKEITDATLLIQYPKKYMHNMLVSVGVEKTFRHASIQASPYLSVPLITNTYSLNGTSGGVRLRIFYNL